ncbi:hypothetical protein [Solirubrobacter soli]|uniref:hypothetical protein n=1 Tax=Solirubrobacter soli TaxID=363832 RepID=UPI000427ACD9|nr:hypothetical protein [Solirubrobacter soli]
MSDPEAHVRLITARLKAAGWDRDPSAEQLDWPTFTHESDHGELTVEYLPGEDWLRIGLATDELEGNLKVFFGTHLEQVLSVVTGAQDTLDPDGWSAFIDELLAVPARVLAIQGEDDEVELRLSDTRSE